MECSSMVSVTVFGLRDPGSNPSWFPVLYSNQNFLYGNFRHLGLSVFSQPCFVSEIFCAYVIDVALLQETRSNPL